MDEKKTYGAKSSLFKRNSQPGAFRCPFYWSHGFIKDLTIHALERITFYTETYTKWESGLELCSRYITFKPKSNPLFTSISLRQHAAYRARIP